MVKLKIETNRLVLKTLTKSSGPSILEFFTRNKDFLNHWEPTRSLGFYTLQYHKKMLRMEQKRMSEGKLLKVWIFKKEDRDFTHPIGSIALNEIIRGCFQSCFIGYKIDANESNKGYMTEAIKAVVQYAFKEMKLHRIEANIIPRNKASLRTVEKNGFVYEGLSKKYLKINGVWEDHVHMVKLNLN